MIEAYLPSLVVLLPARDEGLERMHIFPLLVLLLSLDWRHRGVEEEV